MEELIIQIIERENLNELVFSSDLKNLGKKNNKFDQLKKNPVVDDGELALISEGDAL